MSLIHRFIFIILTNYYSSIKPTLALKPCFSNTSYMLISGYPSQQSSIPEILHIDQDCQPVSCPWKKLELPRPISMAMGGMIASVTSNVIMVCGGYNVQSCYALDLDSSDNLEFEDSAILSSERFAGDTFMMYDRMWILGGVQNGTVTNSTEWVNNGGLSSKGPDLPYEVTFHCMCS